MNKFKIESILIRLREDDRDSQVSEVEGFITREPLSRETDCFCRLAARRRLRTRCALRTWRTRTALLRRRCADHRRYSDRCGRGRCALRSGERRSEQERNADGEYRYCPEWQRASELSNHGVSSPMVVVSDIQRLGRRARKPE